MNKEISEMFWVGMDILGGVILVMFLLGSMTQARQLYSTLESKEMAEEMLAENKEWRGYEGDWVTSADICNLVAQHGSEDTITICLTSYSGTQWYTETAKDSIISTYRNGSAGIILNTVSPKSYNGTDAKNGLNGTWFTTTRKYSQHFVGSNAKPLNEVLNEKASYAVKIARDITGEVRYVKILVCPVTADYSTVWNGM